MRVRSILIGLLAGALLPAMALGFTSVFRSAFTETGETNPTGIAVGDFDHDDMSTDDVVTCHVGGNDLIGFIGFNDGTISQSGPHISLSSAPSGLLKRRFDADTFDDLIIAKANDDAIVFLKGLGNSDFFADPGPPITVGHGPAGLATADLDNDGNLDLVTGNEGDGSSPGSMTVLRGHNDGTFTLVQQDDPNMPGMTIDSLPAELGTRAVAIGNLDSEPGLDVLAANSRSNSISVYTSDGHTVFTTRDPIPTGAAPDDIILSDLNGDGKLDLIVATENDDAVTVQFGNGDRTFGTAQSYPVGTAPNRILLVDLTGDDVPDLLVSNNRSGDVSVLVGTGGGAFAPARTFVADAQPQAIAVGDFDKDGKLDPVAATEGSDAPTVAVLRNRGGGELHAVEDMRAGNGPAALAVGDIDDDGTADLLVSSDGGHVLTFSGGPDGLRAAADFPVGGHALGVVAVDLNGDARPDIAVVDGDNSRIAVFISQGGGHFAAPAFYNTAPNPGAITVGDFDGNGRPDIAVSTVGSDRFCQGGPHPNQSCTQDSQCEPGGICSALGKASVLLQQANGTFGPAHDTDVEEVPTGIAAIDANCDGKDDLVVANLASDTLSVLQACPSAAPCATGAAAGTFVLKQTVSGSSLGQRPIALAVADFDRDGVQDFAVTNTVAPGAQNNVHIFRGNCTGPFAVVTTQGGQVRAGELASAIVARDFTGDGLIDLAVVSQTANSVQLLRGKGDGTMVPIGGDNVSRMPIALAAGDFDLDGRYDAVSANSDPSANNISVLSNCARDPGCDPFGRSGPPGAAALRGDGNGDELRSAADLVAVGREVMDGDGFQVEDIAGHVPYDASPGVDANGDGRVDAQDRVAVAHRIFGGA